MNIPNHFARRILLVAGVVAASLLVAAPEFGHARGGGGHGGGGGGGGGGGRGGGFSGGGFSGGGYHGADGFGGDYRAPDFGDSDHQHHDDYNSWQVNRNYYGEWGARSDNGDNRRELDNDCTSSREDGSAYAHCGSSRYVPRFEGSNVVYGRAQ